MVCIHQVMLGEPDWLNKIILKRKRLVSYEVYTLKLNHQNYVRLQLALYWSVSVGKSGL